MCQRVVPRLRVHWAARVLVEDVGLGLAPLPDPIPAAFFAFFSPREGNTSPVPQCALRVHTCVLGFDDRSVSPSPLRLGLLGVATVIHRVDFLLIAGEPGVQLHVPD